MISALFKLLTGKPNVTNSSNYIGLLFAITVGIVSVVGIFAVWRKVR